MAGMKLTSRLRRLGRSAKTKDGKNKSSHQRRPSLNDDSTIASNDAAKSLHAYDGNPEHSPAPPRLPTLGLGDETTPETVATALSSEGVLGGVELRPAGSCGYESPDDGSFVETSPDPDGARPFADAVAQNPPDINGSRGHDNAERALRDKMQREISRHRSTAQAEAGVEVGEVDPVLTSLRSGEDRSQAASRAGSRASAGSGLSRASKRSIFGKLSASRSSGKKIGGKSSEAEEKMASVDPDQYSPDPNGEGFPGVAGTESEERSRTARSVAESLEYNHLGRDGSYDDECSFEGSVDPPSDHDDDGTYDGAITREYDVDHTTVGGGCMDFSSTTRARSNRDRSAAPRTPRSRYDDDVEAVTSPVSPFLSWLGLATPDGSKCDETHDGSATLDSRGTRDTATYADDTATYDGTLASEASNDPRTSGNSYSPGIKRSTGPYDPRTSTNDYSPGVQRRADPIYDREGRLLPVKSKSEKKGRGKADPPAEAAKSSLGLARKHSFRKLKGSDGGRGHTRDRSADSATYETASATDSGTGTEVTAGGKVVERRSDGRRVRDDGGEDDRDGDPMQMDVYCKKAGGADTLILRKYGGGVPIVSEKDHVLVEIEVRRPS